MIVNRFQSLGICIRILSYSLSVYLWDGNRDEKLFHIVYCIFQLKMLETHSVILRKKHSDARTHMDTYARIHLHAYVTPLMCLFPHFVEGAYTKLMLDFFLGCGAAVQVMGNYFC